MLMHLVEGIGFEPMKPVRATDLQSVPINRSGTPPVVHYGQPFIPGKIISPRGDSNPLTYRLQVGCATVAPLGHHGAQEELYPRGL
jgi:hypothetical protein